LPELAATKTSFLDLTTKGATKLVFQEIDSLRPLVYWLRAIDDLMNALLGDAKVTR
jgi:hypothetical protein